jgi:hypothetical protein
MDYVLEETCIEWRETISSLPLKLTATAIQMERSRWNLTIKTKVFKLEASQIEICQNGTCSF